MSGRSFRSVIIASKTSGPSPRMDGTQVFDFVFAAAEPFFAGHFPGRPILPGVFQIEMVRVAAEFVLGRRLGIHEIARAKFQRPILPDEPVQLVLKLSERDNTMIVTARGTLSVRGEPAGEALLLLWKSE